ncbi:hypothetical protein [Photobacterium sp. 1_MG-2023]|uniref:hypothetical protein n=1 Tax=Photobacterium sp. 1_MG-2023 TaxID=3062646 RepID=UPI0026E2699F|nr:hypothetical protein [Photobacterium sp. 1_MG-2023]MDO6706784.1 hypothetical protein [Photobacterium sp. 1_MG-2023]
MPQMQLADIFTKPEFTVGVNEAQIEKNAFIQSGVQIPDKELMTFSRSTSDAGEATSIVPLSYVEPTYGSDDPDDKLIPQKMGTVQHGFRKAVRTQGWSAMNLAQALAHVDPYAGVKQTVGNYWALDNQRRLIQTFIGLYALNKAGEGDMIKDVATDTTGAITDAERASARNFLDALALKGDMDNVLAVGMHSTVYYGLRKMRHITDRTDPVTNSKFAEFEGKRVIVDDAIPAVAGTNRIKFTSILFGAGAVRAGEGNNSKIKDVETVRDALAGGGTGQDTYITRRTDILVPAGFSYKGKKGSGQTGLFPKLAELADPANWEQIWDSKNIPVSFLVTNG